ncbi:MAG: DUF1573 domain-containing protein [Peptostreptococcaceae bacterium]|nr:DUF1573 domain-containing protein [Peptostreptococcaceae bacterium]
MKTSFVIILSLFLGFAVSAQRISDLPKSQQPQPAPKPQPAQPVQAAQTTQPGTQDSIVFVKTVHDYGTIVQGADGNSEFKFTNKGKSPLILSNVKASCGCIVPEWPKEPILPGKTGVIKLNYNTKIPGTFSKTITVNSNAKNATVILQIKGNVTIPK